MFHGEGAASWRVPPSAPRSPQPGNGAKVPADSMLGSVHEWLVILVLTIVVAVVVMYGVKNQLHSSWLVV